MTSWSPAKGRSPQWRMCSQQVKATLSMLVVRPVVHASRKVCAFRLVWRTSDPEELETVWSHIIDYRLNFDAALKEVPGLEFVVSAISGTISNHRGRPGHPVDSFPAVAYWVVGYPDFHLQVLYDRMQECGTGASLKILFHQSSSTASEKEMAASIFLVMKDYIEGGFVRRKVDIAEGPTGGTRHPIVKFFTRDESCFAMLLDAQQKLAQLKCYVTTESF